MFILELRLIWSYCKGCGKYSTNTLSPCVLSLCHVYVICSTIAGWNEFWEAYNILTFQCKGPVRPGLQPGYDLVKHSALGANGHWFEPRKRSKLFQRFSPNNKTNKQAFRSLFTTTPEEGISLCSQEDSNLCLSSSRWNNNNRWVL